MLPSFRRLWATTFAALFVGVAVLGAARSSDAIPYHGAPDLKLTVDLVTAGTGQNGFDTKVLFAKMYGPRMGAEAHRLGTMYGTAPISNFFTLMNFTVADVLRMVKRDNVSLPAANNPIIPQKLDNSLFMDGLVPEGPRAGQYDVGYMIERLISHDYHHQLMVDLMRRYPHAEVASFHSVLASVVKDSAPKLAAGSTRQ